VQSITAPGVVAGDPLRGSGRKPPCAGLRVDDAEDGLRHGPDFNAAPTAGDAAELFVRSILMRAAGEALETAYFSGTGGVQPLGLLNHAGIGTQSGSSLAHAGLLAMRKLPLDAGAREAMLQWVGTPTIQETLSGRQRFTGSDATLWDSDNGTILGLPAHATKNASSLVVGDFSTSVIGVFGPGLRVDIDPSQDFNSAGLVARVMLMCDVAFPQPSAFCVASTVT
jgi:HK97 family phage major capsid protein